VGAFIIDGFLLITPRRIKQATFNFNALAAPLPVKPPSVISQLSCGVMNNAILVLFYRVVRRGEHGGHRLRGW
jgi:hypothetical protein